MTRAVRNRLGAGLTALAMVFAQVVMPVSSAYATSSTNDNGPNEVVGASTEPKKVYVCKYVGIPGVDERIKSGNEGLIEVSVNAISKNSWDGVTVPAWFSDAHDRSYVIGFVNKDSSAPTVAACPPADMPGKITTPSVNVSVVCGPGNDKFSVSVSPNYSVVDNLDGTYTLTAKTGFVFTTTLTNTVIIEEPADENTACPKPKVCTTVAPIHSTNLAKNGWTLPADAEYVESGIKLNVSGDWDTTYISRDMVGPLADIGNKVEFTADPSQYVGIHITTGKGTLTYEYGPGYDGKWWSNSDFGVASGMGYKTFDTLDNIVAANPGVMTSLLRVLYTHPDKSSSVVTSVTVGCAKYTFDKEVTKVKVCPAEDLPVIRSTDIDANGWTLKGSAEYIEMDGGIKLNVPGNWVSSHISRDMVGTLADIGSIVEFDATPEQYVGIHIKTADGRFLTYEYGPGYDNKWWSTSEFNVASGQGYETFDTLQNIVAANPDVMTSKLYVLYTHPEKSSSVIKSVTVGCTEYVFSKAGGSGGIDTPTTPTTPTVPTTPVVTTPVARSAGNGALLPEELPLTGENGSFLFTWIALLAAILTYGSVYYLQPKKRFEQ